MGEQIFEKYQSFFFQFPQNKFKKDDIIIRADDRPFFLYYIEDGYIQAYRLSQKGEQIPYDIFHTGDIIPLACLIENVRNPYFFKAMTPVTTYRIPYFDFKAFMSKNPKMLYALSLHITATLLRIAENIEHLAIGTAYNKILLRIIFLAKHFGKPISKGSIIIPIPFTHEALAKSVGMTRETTCIQIKKLEKDGIIEYRGHFIILHQSRIAKLEPHIIKISAVK